MPKVKPMGSPKMKASQEAKRAGEMTMKDMQSIARRIKALCKLAGYDNYAQFAGALGMSERRIKYILTWQPTHVRELRRQKRTEIVIHLL